MIIDVLQHVSFEGLAAIEKWGQENGHTFRIHKLYENSNMPDSNDIHFLIVLGGPMSANDKNLNWLQEERMLIKEVNSKKKPILGICLGAQQIAKVLGSPIFQGDHKEVGWHKVESKSRHFDFIPNVMTAFHWHGEQFNIPNGAKQLFSSEACINQGFIYEDRVVALQFHLESTKTSIDTLIHNDRDYLDDSLYVQTEEYIQSTPIPFDNQVVLYGILNHLVSLY